MTKIAVLLPRSTYYSGIGFDIFGGMTAGLVHLGNDSIELVSDNIGFGTDQQLCYRVVESLLLEKQVSIVFAYISHRTAQLLRPLFLAANKLLIVLDSGANLPQEWPLAPNILFHSLHNALGTHLSAINAYSENFREAAMVTGYYDGGYLHMQAGFEAYSRAGGRIVHTHATGYQREQFTMAPLQSWHAQNPSACLLSQFSGDFLQWYFEEIRAHFEPNSTSVYLSPFGCEEQALSAAPYPNQQVSGVAVWSGQLENSENAHFIEAIRSSGREANLFSLLGWEAAFLAVEAEKCMGETKGNGRLAAEKILDFSFSGPRGKIAFHKETHASMGPFYKVSVIEQDGQCRLRVNEILSETTVGNAYEEMISIPLENAISGWHNSYTCI